MKRGLFTDQTEEDDIDCVVDDDFDTDGRKDRDLITVTDKEELKTVTLVQRTRCDCLRNKLNYRGWAHKSNKEKGEGYITEHKRLLKQKEHAKKAGM